MLVKKSFWIQPPPERSAERQELRAARDRKRAQTRSQPAGENWRDLLSEEFEGTGAAQAAEIHCRLFKESELFNTSKVYQL